ncbi:MAG TPA: hypothetical protein VFV38_25825 [Ktedonobacteraceae bacterium]|nr:hypothetical protein [Ktedonobacteraceae bacterium]
MFALQRLLAHFSAQQPSAKILLAPGGQHGDGKGAIGQASRGFAIADANEFQLADQFVGDAGHGTTQALEGCSTLCKPCFASILAFLR